MACGKLAAWNVVPPNTSTERFNDLFHEYDLDGSGEMDLDEFRQLVGILTAQQDAARAEAATAATAAAAGGGAGKVEAVTDADERWELERSAALVLNVVANAAVSAAHHAAAAAAAAYVRTCAPGDAEARRAARRLKGRAMRVRAARRQEERASGSALIGLTIDTTDAKGPLRKSTSAMESPRSSPLSPRVRKGRALREAATRRRVERDELSNSESDELPLGEQRRRRHSESSVEALLSDERRRGRCEINAEPRRAAATEVETTAHTATRFRRRTIGGNVANSAVEMTARQRRRSMSRSESASNVLEKRHPRRSLSRARSASNLREAREARAKQ